MPSCPKCGADLVKGTYYYLCPRPDCKYTESVTKRHTGPIIHIVKPEWDT